MSIQKKKSKPIDLFVDVIQQSPLIEEDIKQSQPIVDQKIESIKIIYYEQEQELKS